MRGCDFAWGVVPGRERELARALKKAGFGFVVRYLSTDPSKRLTHAEVHAYRAEGLHIVTVYEDAGSALLGGDPAGRGMALTARQQLAELGAPAHAPVFFAADFPVTEAEMVTVDAALDSTAYVLTEQLNGVYGSYAAVTQARHVRYRWQTTAWSAGEWDGADNLRQFAISGTTDHVQWDLDESMTSDFGQWIWPERHVTVAVKKKETKAKKAVRKVTKPVRRTVLREPVVTAASASGILSALLTWAAPKAGLHLTVTETRAILTCLPALATLFAALRTTPANVTAFTGALTTMGTASLAFGIHWPVQDIGADAPAIAAVVALILRMHVSPKVAATVVQQVTSSSSGFESAVSRVSSEVSKLAGLASPTPAPVTVTAPASTQVSASSTSSAAAPQPTVIIQPRPAAKAAVPAEEPANSSAAVAPSPFS